MSTLEPRCTPKMLAKRSGACGDTDFTHSSCPDTNSRTLAKKNWFFVPSGVVIARERLKAKGLADPCCMRKGNRGLSSSLPQRSFRIVHFSLPSPNLLRTTVMTNTIVDKSTDNAEPLSICFLSQYATLKKVFISEREQNHDTKKEQALSLTFSQYWFICQNGRS